MVTVPINLDAAAEKLRADNCENELATATHKFSELYEEILTLIDAESIEFTTEAFEIGFITGLEIARGIIEHWGYEYIQKNGGDNGRVGLGKETRNQDSGEGRLTENILSYVQREPKE